MMNIPCAQFKAQVVEGLLGLDIEINIDKSEGHFIEANYSSHYKNHFGLTG